MRRTNSQRTAPFFCCAHALEKVVNTITAIDVPTAKCWPCSPAMPCLPNDHSTIGTVTAPPPMPSSPAKNPAAAPTAASGSNTSMLHIALPPL